MKKDETITQTIINHLTDNKVDKFTIKEMWELFPLIKHNTMSTIVSRDLKKKGLVTPTSERKGMSLIYQFDPNGKPAPKVKKVVTKLRKGVHKKLETDSYDSYVKIGKGIEGLIELKNNTIDHLRKKCDELKKQLIDNEATVQERDRHIVKQGNKIHELNEKIRNKSGGAIKLDELQNIING